MFSMQIVDTDAFLDMSQSSQLLYFHLAMRADDDGFVANPKKVMRMVGIQDDDFKILVAKRFLIIFENGVCVIKHWRLHNCIAKDRYHETRYLNEKSLLAVKKNGSYTERIQNVSKVSTQNRLGKLSLDKIKKDKVNITSELSSHENEKVLNPVEKIMDVFYQINPMLNWGNKTTRKACEEMISKFGFDNTLKMAKQVIDVQGKEYAPIATTPYQMKEKLAQFKIYFDQQKAGNGKGVWRC